MKNFYQEKLAHYVSYSQFLRIDKGETFISKNVYSRMTDIQKKEKLQMVKDYIVSFMNNTMFTTVTEPELRPNIFHEVFAKLQNFSWEDKEAYAKLVCSKNSRHGKWLFSIMDIIDTAVTSQDVAEMVLYRVWCDFNDKDFNFNPYGYPVKFFTFGRHKRPDNLEVPYLMAMAKYVSENPEDENKMWKAYEANFKDMAYSKYLQKPMTILPNPKKFIKYCVNQLGYKTLQSYLNAKGLKKEQVTRAYDFPEITRPLLVELSRDCKINLGGITLSLAHHRYRQLVAYYKKNKNKKTKIN